MNFSHSLQKSVIQTHTVYPKKYAHGFCFAVLCCGHTLTDFPISIRLTSLALWQSNNCPSASKATLMNMDKYFMWIHYERLDNHNTAKHNKTVCIFLGVYCRKWTAIITSRDRTPKSCNESARVANNFVINNAAVKLIDDYWRFVNQTVITENDMKETIVFGSS